MKIFWYQLKEYQIKPQYHSDDRLVRLNDDRSGSIPSRFIPRVMERW